MKAGRVPFDLRGFAAQVVSFHLYSEDVNLLAHSIFRSIARSTVKLITLFLNVGFIPLPKNVFLFGELLSPCVNKWEEITCLSFFSTAITAAIIDRHRHQLQILGLKRIRKKQ